MTDDPSTERHPEPVPPAAAIEGAAASPAPPPPAGRPAVGAASGHRTPSGPVQYKGADLDPERGPGLGCFWIQVVVLAILVVLTPLSVSLGWPSEVSAILLFVTIGLLLLVGQTIIFLLRLVAADRRGRRRPLASSTRTVGEIEDATAPDGGSAADASDASDAGSSESAVSDPGPEPSGDVRQ